ncbi:hypothetical protein [Chitinimonas sp. BJYL2]|uniref:DUF4870 family protein n=1 Tax=Chitinimonas sp. BJYL2 TaxID=2976696 RepID=UPI0022B33370|nr:hypothetical protein [Chitinimonas sp. BJYL2]
MSHTMTIDDDAADQSLKNLALINYVLLGISLFTALPTGLIAVIIAHVKRGEASGWMRSHYDYLITTFWTAILCAVIAVGLCITIIGIPAAILLVAGAWVWTLYRVIKGAIHLGDGRYIEK